MRGFRCGFVRVFLSILCPSSFLPSSPPWRLVTEFSDTIMACRWLKGMELLCIIYMWTGTKAHYNKLPIVFPLSLTSLVPALPPQWVVFVQGEEKETDGRDRDRKALHNFLFIQISSLRAVFNITLVVLHSRTEQGNYNVCGTTTTEQLEQALLSPIITASLLCSQEFSSSSFKAAGKWETSYEYSTQVDAAAAASIVGGSKTEIETEWWPVKSSSSRLTRN